MILEQIIETKLRETYAEDEINEFYKSFKDNLANYEKIDADVVNTIFGFTDFEKFKQTILVYKRGLDAGEKPAKKDAEDALPLH